MSENGSCPFSFSRRGFLGLAGGLAAAGFGVGAKALGSTPPQVTAADPTAFEPFWGTHQAGIVTPLQTHTYFATFDLATDKGDDVIALLKAWTVASARMAKGETAQPVEGQTSEAVPADSGESLGLAPAGLTITIGFGPGLFTKDGKDRYGLATKRPAAFIDLPAFTGDQLVPEHTGGDLSVQACSDDPQVAFHAVRQLARLANYKAQIRWTQAGFMTKPKDGGTPRNLMGFKDGTGNPLYTDQSLMDKIVWVGAEGPDWMQGGSYMVARRIRIALEHWDQMKIGFQEQTVGREKYSGAPIGMKKESDPLDLNAGDKDGNPVIAENAHVRLAAAAPNDGAQILRRPYSYNDGVNFTAERWPPWRQGMEYDAGLFFICYQRDPRRSFIKIYEKMAKFDMMNQFVTHIGGGLFAIPPGMKEGEFVGQRLFAA